MTHGATLLNETFVHLIAEPKIMLSLVLLLSSFHINTNIQYDTLFILLKKKTNNILNIFLHIYLCFGESLTQLGPTNPPVASLFLTRPL